MEDLIIDYRGYQINIFDAQEIFGSLLYHWWLFKDGEFVIDGGVGEDNVDTAVILAKCAVDKMIKDSTPTLEDLLKSDRPSWLVYKDKRLVYSPRLGKWKIWQSDDCLEFDELNEAIAALTEP